MVVLLVLIECKNNFSLRFIKLKNVYIFYNITIKSNRKKNLHLILQIKEMKKVKKQKVDFSAAGNRTRGAWVKTRNVTDYTTAESLKLDNT